MSRRRVLIMDSDVEASDVLHMAAERLEFTTLAVHDLDSLVASLARGAADVLIVDVDQLGATDIPLLRWFHTLQPGLLIVPTSASGALALEAHVRQQGVFYFLTKPLEREEFLLVLHDALQARTPGAEKIFTPLHDAEPVGLTSERTDVERNG